MIRLEIVKENISTATIVGTTCAILVLLFLIQPLGTTKIASVFAPIVIVWLTLNFCFGIYVFLSSMSRGVHDLTECDRTLHITTTRS